MTKRLPLILLLGLAACAKSEGEAPDAGVTPDAGPVDAGPPAARYLVEPKGLFGDTPVSNRFLNPNFDLNAEGWLAYPTREGASALPTVQRRFETDTPTRQPLLFMPKAMNTHGVGVVGTARAGQGPFEVTIWIGRPIDDADEPTHVSIVGTHPTDGEIAWELAPIEGTATDKGDRRWVQWGLRLDVGPVGFANLVVYDDGDVPIYLSGPVMLPAAQQRLIGPEVQLDSRPRPVAGAEARAMSAVKARFRRDMGIAPPRPSLPATSPRR